MNNKKFNEKRRAALKKSIQGAAATGAVTAAYSWKKPIVESMILPAHAATTSLDPKSLAITNLTITESNENANGEVTLSANNLVSGTNIGTTLYDGSGDYGAMKVIGKIMPVPPAGTEVNVAAITTFPIDSTVENCFFRNPNPCTISIPVNSTNGDFSISGVEVNGLDDNRGDENSVEVTFTCLDTPPFVVDFTIRGQPG